LKDHDEHLILLLDEDYIEPKALYKSRCIKGKSQTAHWKTQQQSRLLWYRYHKLLHQTKKVR